MAGFSQYGRPGWLFAVVLAIGMVFFITSLTHTTVAHVAVIYATVPFVAAALAWLVMRERPSVNAVIASAAALAGVIIMVGLGVEGNLLESMRNCVAATPLSGCRIFGDYRLPCPDTTSRRSSAASRRGSAFGFAAGDARLSGSTASAASWRSAC